MRVFAKDVTSLKPSAGSNPAVSVHFKLNQYVRFRQIGRKKQAPLAGGF